MAKYFCDNASAENSRRDHKREGFGPVMSVTALGACTHNMLATMDIRIDTK